jgi:hypothetical protein
VILLSFSKENLKPTIASLALFSRRNRDPWCSSAICSKPF